MFKKILKEKRERSLVAKKSKLKENAGMLMMCRKCYSFKYDNSWHFERPEHLLEHDPDDQISVQFSQCPACIEESLAMYDMEYV